MPLMYGEIYNNLKEMNLIEADLSPNLQDVQKYTPGEIPSNTQGDTLATDPPSDSEFGAATPAQSGIEAGNPLPEVRPPRSPKSPI